MTTRSERSPERPGRLPYAELERLKIAPGKFVYRRCRVCEWEGQLAQSPRSEPDCPACHAPTDLVAFLQPMSETDALQKNPHAAALGRLGGQRGGPARAAVLSPKRRRENRAEGRLGALE